MSASAVPAKARRDRYCGNMASLGLSGATKKKMARKARGCRLPEKYSLFYNDNSRFLFRSGLRRTTLRCDWLQSGGERRSGARTEPLADR
jgi:hypothetical protein